jgi:hypothetical protein
MPLCTCRKSLAVGLPAEGAGGVAFAAAARVLAVQQPGAGSKSVVRVDRREDDQEEDLDDQLPYVDRREDGQEEDLDDQLRV